LGSRYLSYLLLQAFLVLLHLATLSSHLFRFLLLSSSRRFPQSYKGKDR
jgi:hypothetical protein